MMHHHDNAEVRAVVQKQIQDTHTSGNGFVTSVWGPLLWTVLHLISLNYPVNPTTEQRAQYHAFILALQHVLPCGACRRNMPSALQQANFTVSESLRDRASFVMFMYDFHNSVTHGTGKPVLSLEKLTHTLLEYEMFRAECSSSQLVIDHAAPCLASKHTIQSQCVIQIVPATGSPERLFNIHPGVVYHSPSPSLHSTSTTHDDAVHDYIVVYLNGDVDPITNRFAPHCLDSIRFACALAKKQNCPVQACVLLRTQAHQLAVVKSDLTQNVATECMADVKLCTDGVCRHQFPWHHRKRTVSNQGPRSDTTTNTTTSTIVVYLLFETSPCLQCDTARSASSKAVVVYDSATYWSLDRAAEPSRQSPFSQTRYFIGPSLSKDAHLLRSCLSSNLSTIPLPSEEIGRAHV